MDFTKCLIAAFCWNFWNEPWCFGKMALQSIVPKDEQWSTFRLLPCTKVEASRFAISLLLGRVGHVGHVRHVRHVRQLCAKVRWSSCHGSSDPRRHGQSTHLSLPISHYPSPITHYSSPIISISPSPSLTFTLNLRLRLPLHPTTTALDYYKFL